VGIDATCDAFGSGIADGKGNGGGIARDDRVEDTDRPGLITEELLAPCLTA